MEKIKFMSEEMQEEVDFFVLEQTKVNGISYILVTDSEEDDAECLILKDTSEENAPESVYEIVDDDVEPVSYTHLDVYKRQVQDKAGYEKYDIVAANILADVLVPLTPVIVNQMKPGGIYITSGIIEDKEETVVQAVMEAGLEVLEVNHQGEWVSVTARKNQE